MPAQRSAGRAATPRQHPVGAHGAGRSGQLWTAHSPETTTPVVGEGTVVTGSGHDLVGHDPTTGAQLWSFARDSDLCAVTWLYDLAVAVYPDSRGCGQVSTVDGLTGRRGPTRTGYADKQIESVHGRHSGAGRRKHPRGAVALRHGAHAGLGRMDAPVNPPVQPQPPCTFLSTAASTDAVSILQACPNVPDLRLTMLKVAKEDVTPDAEVVTADRRQASTPAPRSSRSPARARPSTCPYRSRASSSTTTPARRCPSRRCRDRRAPASWFPGPAASSPYWTGDSVVVFDGTSLTYRYTIGASATATPIGPGVMMANRLLIPVINGMAVFDPGTGQPEHVIPVNRPALSGPVVPGVAGTTVLEQRGDQIVALGQRK